MAELPPYPSARPHPRRSRKPRASNRKRQSFSLPPPPPALRQAVHPRRRPQAESQGVQRLENVLRKDERTLAQLPPAERQETESWLDKGLRLLKDYGPSLLEAGLALL